jgi:hypothetical protein
MPGCFVFLSNQVCKVIPAKIHHIIFLYAPGCRPLGRSPQCHGYSHGGTPDVTPGRLEGNLKADPDDKSSAKFVQSSPWGRKNDYFTWFNIRSFSKYRGKE